MIISENLKQILPNIPKNVILVAAVKYANDEQIKELIQNGINNLGFNTHRQLLQVKNFANASFHFIGHLQRNKVKDILPFCALIHSIDSIKLAKKISEEAAKIKKQQEILLQIKTDSHKEHGFEINEIKDALKQISKMEHLSVKGLMTIPAQNEDARKVYRKLKQLKEELNLEELSMGMSNDYKTALEEGATIVRIGRILFEPPN